MEMQRTFASIEYATANDANVFSTRQSLIGTNANLVPLTRAIDSHHTDPHHTSRDSAFGAVQPKRNASSEQVAPSTALNRLG